MAGNANDIEIGACWVYFGSVAGNIGEQVDLGYTKGGVTISIETSTYPITVDQEGESPVGETIMGRACTVTVPMAESNYARLNKLIPDSTYVAGVLNIKSGIGANLMSYTDILQLVRKDDANKWIKVYKSAPVVSLQATFLPNSEVLWPMQFKGYIPETGHTYQDILAAFSLGS